MVFSSLTFICIFLPVIFLLNCIIPNNKIRNAILIIGCIVFYAYGEPVYVFILLGVSIFNYLMGLLAEKHKHKLVLVLTVALNIGTLGVFKYTAFLVSSFNSVTNLHVHVPEITLPIGISFYIFQALSYVIDVYMGRVEAQKNYFKVLLYLSFFPQLIAGPIVKYRDISHEIDNRKITVDNVTAGMMRFIIGLGKKVLIANTMGTVADAIFSASSSDINILSAWLGALAYLFQIYNDFSGYSDMAIGLGLMFGFHFKENFMHPYGATSIKDFWRKWHISMSGWFKEYLYIPLGGNRKGTGRTYLNKIVVFLLTGLWHGANWTFIVWGLYHGLFLLLEDMIPSIKKAPKAIGHIYTVIVVCCGFVIFRADTLMQGLVMIGKMFSGWSFERMQLSLLVQQLTPWFIFMFLAAVIGAAPIQLITAGIKKIKYQNAVYYTKMFLCVLLFAWCILRLSSSTYNPFIYFQF